MEITKASATLAIPCPSEHVWEVQAILNRHMGEAQTEVRSYLASIGATESTMIRGPNGRPCAGCGQS